MDMFDEARSYRDMMRARGITQKKLAEFPDLIYSDQAAEVTGYTRKTVIRWCSKGHLPCLYKHPKTYIPKKDFLLFLLSETYNKIAKKSETHLWDIKHIHQKFRNGGKNNGRENNRKRN